MTQDLLTVRLYEYDGIKVWVEIDRVKRKASLVEPDGVGGYRPKKWLFAERSVGYMKSWTHIMDAMCKATNEAIKDLQEVEDELTLRTAELMQKVADEEHKRKAKK